MGNAVRAEASAVADLTTGVGRYAVHIGKALDEARSQLDGARQKVLTEVGQRRGRCEQTARMVAQAEATLARAAPQERAAAAAEVAKARSAHANAKVLLETARRASATIDRAAGELQKSLSTAQAHLDAHAGASRSYLATLEAQLKTIAAGSGGGDHASAVVGTLAMIGKALVGEVAVEAGLTAVERLAHLPDGTSHEVGGLVKDMISTAVDSPRLPLGEGDAFLKFGGNDTAGQSGHQ